METTTVAGPLTSVWSCYLTVQEADQISQQFQSDSFVRNKQLLWSGMLQETAQKWADVHGMQTLTTAMGPLKTPGHPSYLRAQKGEKGWSKYIKGASILFAYKIALGDLVTVLTPPPPDRFHPSGQTNYQSIEEPILKGLTGDTPVGRIYMVHPSVAGAEDFRYQIWPVDESSQWIDRYKGLAVPKLCWRPVKLKCFPSCFPQGHGQAKGGTAPFQALLETVGRKASTGDRRLRIHVTESAGGLSGTVNEVKASTKAKACEEAKAHNKATIPNELNTSTKAKTTEKVNAPTKVKASTKVKACEKVKAPKKAKAPEKAETSKKVLVTTGQEVMKTTKSVELQDDLKRPIPSQGPASLRENLCLIVALECLIGNSMRNRANL